MLFIFLFPLFFLALGIFGLWLGIRRIRRNGEEWLRISMEASDYPDVVNTGKSVKTVHRMNLAVFSDHWTFARVQAKKEVAQRLQAMLLEKNPGIDTADGRVLNDREYNEMERKYIEERKSRNAQDGRS